MKRNLLALAFNIAAMLLKELIALTFKTLAVLIIIALIIGWVRQHMDRKPYEFQATVTSSEGVYYTTKARINQKSYDFGEPVRFYFELTNISPQTITLRSSSPITPAVDLVMRRVLPEDPSEVYVWSKTHPDQARHEIRLQPGETYAIEWTLTLARPGVYEAQTLWVEPSLVSSSRPSKGWSRATTPCVLYGVRKDDPAVWALCHPLNIGRQATGRQPCIPNRP